LPATLTRVALAVIVALAACKPKPGDECHTDEVRCQGPQAAIACIGQKFTTVPCRGPAGCGGEKKHATCDDSAALAGEACLPSRENVEMCAGDGKADIACEGGRWALRSACKGPKGCSVVGERVACDSTVAARGDVCRVEGAFACSADHKEAFVCHGGRYDVSRECRGSLGCAFEDDALTCDESGGREGDPCSKDSLIACSEDGTSELTCIGGRFGRPRRCAQGCKVLSHRRIECQ
jgi:hypothetical protein